MAFSLRQSSVSLNWPQAPSTSNLRARRNRLFVTLQHAIFQKGGNAQHSRIIMTGLPTLTLPFRLIVPIPVTQRLELLQLLLLVRREVIQVADEPRRPGRLRSRRSRVVLAVFGRLYRRGIALRLAVVGFGTPQRHSESRVSCVQDSTRCLLFFCFLYPRLIR